MHKQVLFGAKLLVADLTDMCSQLPVTGLDVSGQGVLVT